MYVEIYADVIFLINLIMDYFVFWVVSKLVKKKVAYLRLLFGALITAILFCTMIFVPVLSAHMNIFFAMLTLALGILVSFKPNGIKEFLRLMLLAHGAAFTVGGLGIALFYYTNIPSYISGIVSFTAKNFSVWILVVTTIGSYIVLKLLSGLITRVFIDKQCFCLVEISLDNNTAFLNALVDTGNSLRDPLTDAPVLIAEFDKLVNILPDSLKVIFYEQKESDISLLMSVSDTSTASKIRIIPFSSLGNQNGMLIGFKPDKIVIFSDTEIVRDDIIIGIYNSELSKNGAYDGLLNPSMLC